MAQDIVPIELGLPQGDIVTLWAPRWREEGEEWEAFLGYGEELYAFPDTAHLVAFIRTAGEHDLTDHPAWHAVPGLAAVDLLPDEDHQYDLVGVPELVSGAPDTWTIGELAEIVSITRSLADVCGLDTVHEVLDSAEGFGLLQHGSLAFNGRDGSRRWDEIGRTVAQRWDEMLDAIDGMVTIPEISQKAVSAAETELAEVMDTGDSEEDSERAAAEADTEAEDEEARHPFWSEVGIDPIKIITSGGEYYSLRCYLDDEPVFLGSQGRIAVFTSARALARHLASDEIAQGGNDLARVATWPKVVEKANAGELEVVVDHDNTYVLPGLDEDLAEGPNEVDPNQLDLAEELLTDVAKWAGDDTVERALRPSERLGWLVSYVLRPSPTRLAPSAPFDAEVAAWQELVHQFEERLQVH